jgi:hypothetical protein
MASFWRRVEMLYAWQIGDSGTWDTSSIYVPINTPIDQIETVARQVAEAQLRANPPRDECAGVYVYNIPEIDDTVDFDGNVFAFLLDSRAQRAMLDAARERYQHILTEVAEAPDPLNALLIYGQPLELQQEWTDDTTDLAAQIGVWLMTRAMVDWARHTIDTDHAWEEFLVSAAVELEAQITEAARAVHLDP